MNSTIRLTNWSPGLNSVRLIKLVREVAGVPLNGALDMVNCFLAGEPIDVAISPEAIPVDFAERFRELGVGTECIDVEIPAH